MSWNYNLVSVDGTFDQGKRNYSVVYHLYTDDPTEKGIGPGSAASLVPGILYTPFVYGGDTDLLAILKKKSASSDNNGLSYMVTLEYDSEPFVGGDGTQVAATEGGDPATDPSTMDASTPPDERPWQLSTGSNQTQKVFVKDLQVGTPVTFSNDQPVDPPIMLPATIPTLTFTGFKALASDSVANKVYFEDSINSAAVTIAGYTIPAKQGRVASYNLGTQYEHGNWWWTKTVVIEVNPDGPFNPVEFLDQGTFMKVTTSGWTKAYRAIRDPQGDPVTSPVPLDGVGQPLSPGGTPVMRNTYVGYRETDWSTLL